MSFLSCLLREPAKQPLTNYWLWLFKLEREMKEFLKYLKAELISDGNFARVGLGIGCFLLGGAATALGLGLFSVAMAGTGTAAAEALVSGLACLGVAFGSGAVAAQLTKRRWSPTAQKSATEVSYHRVEASRLSRKQPLGPKFHAVALTAEEAAPYTIRKATVLLNATKVSKSQCEATIKRGFAS
ncbi:MAG: hypothetical protein GC185_06750 [Alphaproteobacteria bacterium]|nr:hypothetical protein [Alphaproteobacteria bacterium]